MHFELFADDSNVFISLKSHANLFQIIVNSELPHMGDWFKANKLSLNLTKTLLILFTSHRKILPTHSLPLEIDGMPILQGSHIGLNFLGVVIDN